MDDFNIETSPTIANVVELIRERNRLLAQVEELRADAERYRWLKQQYSTFDYDQRQPTVLDAYSEAWDRNIDAALREEE
jgi:hypothetical protein